MFRLDNTNYRSKKHPVLEHIFRKYYDPQRRQKIISFYLSDISEGYSVCGMREPVSISNTILDLTRQDRGIESRVPGSISDLGYDLRKRTGQDVNRKKFAGEFVFVGIGSSLKSWLIWPDKLQERVINSTSLPPVVASIVRPDEGGLFSVIDYLDVLSKALYGGKKHVLRVQNPMKWQPNEIDGLYACQDSTGLRLFPVEAKALTTGDEVNLDQLTGCFRTVVGQMKKTGLRADLQQLAIKMVSNGINIAVFPENSPPTQPAQFIRVKFDPPIRNWR